MPAYKIESGTIIFSVKNKTLKLFSHESQIYAKLEREQKRNIIKLELLIKKLKHISKIKSNQ